MAVIKVIQNYVFYVHSGLYLRKGYILGGVPPIVSSNYAFLFRSCLVKLFHLLINIHLSFMLEVCLHSSSSKASTFSCSTWWIVETDVTQLGVALTDSPCGLWHAASTSRRARRWLLFTYLVCEAAQDIHERAAYSKWDRIWALQSKSLSLLSRNPTTLRRTVTL